LRAINRAQIDIEFMEETFHRLYEGLHRYAYSLTGDNEAAKDVVQQVFMNLWEKRDLLNISKSVKSYLFRAVHNVCINLQTRTVRHDPIHHLWDDEKLAPGGIQPVLLMEIQELQGIIDHTIELLPPHCKAIFKKSRGEEKSYPAIAREMGISPKTVEAQMSKALKIIRSAVEKYL
jgi:RNA polymerase sigma-70 factor (ECF subfamily)